MEHKCAKCRNTFQTCSSNPVFVTEEEAEIEGVPRDLIKDCDAFEPEECCLDDEDPEDDWEDQESEDDDSWLETENPEDDIEEWDDDLR